MQTDLDRLRRRVRECELTRAEHMFSYEERVRQVVNSWIWDFR